MAINNQLGPAAVIGNKANVWICLDKNECPHDVALSVKERVLEDLHAVNWNKYPAPVNSEVEKFISEYAGFDQDMIVASPGSVAMLTALMSYYALSGKRLIIAQPSFHFSQVYCRQYHIPFESWPLSADLEYDPDLLPPLDKDSVVIFDSPNNPVGNILAEPILEDLLNRFPHTLFIADEVYFEYAGFSHEKLLNRYENLLIIRSFSKTFAAAGVRLGYLIGQANHTAYIRKLILPFSINHFTFSFAKVVLQNRGFILAFEQRIKSIVNEREALYERLTAKARFADWSVKRSYANFFLIRFDDRECLSKVAARLERAKIKVHFTPDCPQLRNGIRVSIGESEANRRLLEALEE